MKLYSLIVLALLPALAMAASDSADQNVKKIEDPVLGNVVDISATCQDLYWISFSVMSTWNNMYSSCIINPQVSDVCKWMKNVVGSTTGWIQDNGCQTSESFGSFAMAMDKVNLPSAQSVAYSFAPPDVTQTSTTLIARNPISSSILASIAGFLGAVVIVGGTAFSLRHKIVRSMNE